MHLFFIKLDNITDTITSNVNNMKIGCTLTRRVNNGKEKYMSCCPLSITVEPNY